MKFKTLILILLFPLCLIAQEQKDRITLTTGEVYSGKIVFQNESMLVIRTDDGARFQFQLSQIQTQIKVDERELKAPNKETTTTHTTNFRLLPSIQVGVNNAKHKFDYAISTDISLAMGINDFSGKNWFVGGGLAVFSLFDPTSNETENFLPLFIRSQANFGNKKNALFWGVDAGYHFALNNNYKGGLFSKISLGYSHQISSRACLQFSLSAAIRNIEAELVENRNSTNYIYTGNSNIAGLGLNVGFMF